jgi:hypothetical protein
LTDDQYNETKEQGRVTQPIAPIAGRAELQERQTEGREHDRYAQIRQCSESLKDWAQKVSKDFGRKLHHARFVLEVLGFFVLTFYAWQAYKQRLEMTRSVAQQVLSSGPLMYPNGVAPTGFTVDNIPNKAHIRFHNYGNSLALNIVTIGHIIMGDAKTPPHDPGCNPNATSLPKEGSFVDALETGADRQPLEKDWFPINERELIQANNGRTLYVVGCVYYYGIDRTHLFFTDICLYWDRAKPQVFQTCNDTARSYAR